MPDPIASCSRMRPSGTALVASWLGLARFSKRGSPCSTRREIAAAHGPRAVRDRNASRVLATLSPETAATVPSGCDGAERAIRAARAASDDLEAGIVPTLGGIKGSVAADGSVVAASAVPAFSPDRHSVSYIVSRWWELWTESGCCAALRPRACQQPQSLWGYRGALVDDAGWLLLAADPEVSVRSATAKSQVCPEHCLDTLTKDRAAEVRLAAASGRGPLNGQHLMRLARDEAVTVRRAVASRESLPGPVRAVLRYDRDPKTREAMAAHDPRS